MANVILRQILEDGNRNTIVKVVGILDTSDVVATGTVGASGFTTTLGLKTIAFVAGALVPMVGQYLTFGDSTTTFPAGTYVTSITDATHIVVNNKALATNAAAAITITGTAGMLVLLDPAMLHQIGLREGLANRLLIDHIQFNIEDLLSVYLYWEATANDLIVPLEGRGKLCPRSSWINTETAGTTGKILLDTQGWASSAVLSFMLEVHVHKSIHS